MTRIVESLTVEINSTSSEVLNRAKNQSSKEEALWDEGTTTTMKYYMSRTESTSFPGLLVGVSGP